VSGVSGAGKTTLGKLVAKELSCQFYDADDFHSQVNIEKMRHGIPLTDDDREPWLMRLRELVAKCVGVNTAAVLACSALKKKYRDVLRVNDRVRFIFLRGDYATVAAQLESRRDHFFNADLLRSQFADLEEPQPDERAIVTQIGRSPRELAHEVIAQLRQSYNPKEPT
jgi:gluconokinase